MSPAVLGKALSLTTPWVRWVDSACGASGDREHGPTFADWSSYRLHVSYVISLGYGGGISACWIPAWLLIWGVGPRLSGQVASVRWPALDRPSCLFGGKVLHQGGSRLLPLQGRQGRLARFKGFGGCVSISFPAERKFRLVRASPSRKGGFFLKESANRRDVEFVNL